MSNDHKCQTLHGVRQSVAVAWAGEPLGFPVREDGPHEEEITEKAGGDQKHLAMEKPTNKRQPCARAIVKYVRKRSKGFSCIQNAKMRNLHTVSAQNFPCTEPQELTKTKQKKTYARINRRKRGMSKGCTFLMCA